MIPLRAVGFEIGEVVDVLPELLDVDDMLADGGSRAGLALEIVGGRKMIGMRMGIEDPFDLQPLFRNMGEDGVGTSGRDGAGLLVEIEHGVYDRAGFGGRIGDDVLDAAGPRLVETL